MRSKVPPGNDLCADFEDDDNNNLKLKKHPFIGRCPSILDTRWELSGFGYVYKEPIVEGASKCKVMVN